MPERHLQILLIFGAICLLATIAVRGRVYRYPIFTAYVVFLLITAVAGLIEGHALSVPTTAVYAALEGLLQFGVLYEISVEAFSRPVNWPRKTRVWVPIGVMAATFLVLGMIAMIETDKIVLDWPYRIELFCNLLIALLVTGLFVVAERLHRFLNAFVTGIATGLSIVVLLSITGTLLSSYQFDRGEAGPMPRTIRTAAYLAAFIIWTVSFVRREPAPKKLTIEMKAQIESLHKTSSEATKFLDDSDQY